MDLISFLSAMLQDWVSLMSGIASIILIAIGFVEKWQTVPRGIVILAGVICFFLASMRVWTQEHRARLKSENTLERLTIPKLSGSIDWTVVAPAQNDKSCLLWIGATIRNSGAPTIADNFLVRAKLVDGREHDFRFLPLSKDDMILRGKRNQPQVVLSVSDYLPRKNSEKPIPNGGAGTGWIFVLGEGIAPGEILQQGVTIAFSFADFTGKRWEVIKEMAEERGEPFLLDPRKLQNS
jgi:hypothetical protein